jgi:quinohemoprotein ethanol dehydrogenase
MAIGIVLIAWVAAAQQAKRTDDAALKNAGKTDEWLTYGLNQYEQRYSTLKQIDATNVSKLGLAWSYDVGSGGGGQEATPLFYNGTLYGITNWSIVFAVDAHTGKEKWRWDPEVNQDKVRSKICCGIVNRGVALYEGKIIAPVIDGRLEALDADTGKVVWEARVAYPQDQYTITMAPRIAKGKVIVGVSGAEYPVRGFFDGYDAKTGQRAWRFYTVPGDPSKPFENEAMKKAAATWEGDFWKLGGGGTVWDGVAYDPDADLIYVGTGNGGPWPEPLRHSKGKDNLYVASIVAVRPDTGELKWYYQIAPGDSWDYDSVQQLMLADLTINGRQRKVIMQANKGGFFYVLDRITGEFISGEPWVQLNWAKGLDPKTGRPIVNPEARYGKDPVSIFPGPGGAHNWAPMAFNPATGLVYIPTSASTFGSSYAVDVDSFVYRPGANNIGVNFGGFGGGGGRGGPPGPGGAGPGAPAGAGARGAATPPPAPVSPPAIGPVREAPAAAVTPAGGQPGFGAGSNWLVAWDPTTQKERWRQPGGGSIGGGALSTASNLVFQVLPDGRLMGYSADKGEKLFEVQTGQRGGMGPPITYMLDGKQYITLMGGQGGGQPPQGARGGPPAAPAAPGTQGAATQAAVAQAGAAGGQTGPGAPGPGAPGPGAAGPGGFGGFGGPVVPPRMLTFVLDGKAPLPGQ